MTRMELNKQRAEAYEAGNVIFKDADKIQRAGRCTWGEWYDMRAKGYDLIRAEIKKINTNFFAAQAFIGPKSPLI